MTHIVEDVSAGYAGVCVSTRRDMVHVLRVLERVALVNQARIPEQVTWSVKHSIPNQ